mgnify:CR=1 FL=1
MGSPDARHERPSPSQITGVSPSHRCDAGVQSRGRGHPVSTAPTTLATFTGLSDMCAFTVSPGTNRWYWHHEGVSQFGGSDESIGYCNATFTVGGTGGPGTGLGDSCTAGVGACLRRDTTQVGQDNHELVATQSRHRVAFPGAPDQALRGLLEQLVANVMTKCVIEDLEVVKIDEQQRAVLLASSTGGHGLTQAIQ